MRADVYVKYARAPVWKSPSNLNRENEQALSHISVFLIYVCVCLLLSWVSVLYLKSAELSFSLALFEKKMGFNTCTGPPSIANQASCRLSAYLSPAEISWSFQNLWILIS
jgi:hypothetical protein